MENNQPSILDDLAGIIDAAGEKLQHEATADRAVLHAAMMRQFRLTDRQAHLALQSVALQTQQGAAIHSTTPADFLRMLGPNGKIAMFAFTAGCVHQHDLDHLLDPITGERLQ